MSLSRENLTGSYNWHEEGHATSFTGGATRRRFNRFNGNQVLFIINVFQSLTEPFSAEEQMHVENLIQNKLPLQPQSELTVIDWLTENFVETSGK